MEMYIFIYQSYKPENNNLKMTDFVDDIDQKGRR